MIAYDPCQLLRVPENAPPEEIIRAFYRKARTHPPERSASNFRLICRAYDFLCSPGLRARHDACRNSSSEIADAYVEINEMVQQKNYFSAIARLKRLVAKAPHLDGLRDDLAFLYYHTGQYQKAAFQYDRLADMEIPLPCYISFAAKLRLEWARILQGEEKPKQKKIRKLLLEGRELFTKASLLEPDRNVHLLGLTEVNMALKDYDRAMECVNRIAQNCTRANYQEFDALFLGCIIHILRDDNPSLHRACDHILHIIAGREEDLVEHVAWKFFSFANDLADLQNYERAMEVMKIAKEITPGEIEEFDLLINYYRDLDSLAREFGRLTDDYEDVILKYMLSTEYKVSRASDEDVQEARQQWNEMVERLNRLHPGRALHWLGRLKTECPTFYRRNREFVDKLIETHTILSGFLAEASSAYHDRAVPEVLRHICALVHDLALGQEDQEEERLIHYLKLSGDKVKRESARAIRDGVEHIRQHYGILYNAHEKMWLTLEAAAGTQRPWWRSSLN